MTYKCIIVDDERPALKLLDAYISKLPHLELVVACESGMEAIVSLQRHQVDILFLDIQMPDLTGLELLKTLNKKPQVILTTAYRDYAVEGFALDVTDYLVKPFSFERFIQGVNKATEILTLKHIDSPSVVNTREDSTATSTSPQDGHIFLKVGHKMDKVAIHNILYIESMREYIGVHTAEKRYIVHHTMKAMEERLPPPQFMRIHRSYLINMNQIDGIKGNMVLIKDQQLVIGGSYRKDFFERIERL